MQPLSIRVKHRGAEVEVALRPDECPYTTVGAALRVPPDRLKMLRAGRQLPPSGSPKLWDEIRTADGAVFLALGSHLDEQLPAAPGLVQRSVRAAVDVLGALSLQAVWGWVAASVGVIASFFHSMVVRPELPERARRRDE